jgi:hypothetical protein
VGITDSRESVSKFEGVRFTNSRIINITVFESYLPAFYLEDFRKDSAFVQRRISVGSKYSSKVMKGILEINNCTFTNEERLLDLYLSQVTFRNSTIQNYEIKQEEGSYISSTYSKLII